MIWQLMKLDVSWRFVVRQTILFAVLAVAWHLFAGKTEDPGTTLLLMVLVPWFSIGLTPFVQPKDTRFQATLPITVRQVFAARMFSMMALQWLPVAAGASILVVLGGPGGFGMPLRTWSVVTCIVLGGQCASVRGLTIRRPLHWTVLPVALYALVLAAVVWDWPLQSYPALTFAILCCWMATAGVVARTWRIVPKAFELALGETPSDAVDPTLKRGLWWKPVLGTLFPLWGFEYLVIFGVMCVLHSPIIVLGVSGQGWTSMRTAVRWLLPLPVHRHALLAATVLPGILSLSCGYLVGLHIPYFSILQTDKGIRSQIVTLVLIAGWSMLANLCAMAGDWHIIRRVLPPRNWPAIFASPIVGLALLLLLGAFYVVRGFQPVRWLSVTLPSSLAGAIALCLVPLAMLWWALDTMFRQLEFADKPARGVA